MSARRHALSIRWRRDACGHFKRGCAKLGETTVTLLIDRARRHRGPFSPPTGLRQGRHPSGSRRRPQPHTCRSTHHKHIVYTHATRWRDTLKVHRQQLLDPAHTGQRAHLIAMARSLARQTTIPQWVPSTAACWSRQYARSVHRSSSGR